MAGERYRLIVKNGRAVMQTLGGFFNYLFGIKDVSGAGTVANGIVDWTIQNRTKTTSEWNTDTTTILLRGQLGIEDTGDGNFKAKLGTGLHLWAALGYITGSGGTTSFASLTGLPTDNAALASALSSIQSDIDNHVADTNNPHGVTAVQVGTYTTTQIDSKDVATLSSANTYTDNQVSGKENSANKSTSTSDSASTSKFPVWAAVVSYVTGLGYLLASTASSTYVALAGAYTNPSWITSLAWSKLTGKPATDTEIGYLSGATSSIQTQFNTLLGHYNVKAYGAVGDGSTNDSAAIQAAITASISATGNAAIFFPNGRYKVNSILSIDNATANVSILGFNSTLVSGISTVGSSVLFIAQAKTVVISGLNIDFNSQNTVHYGYRIADQANTKYVGVCRITDCDFYNFGTEATRGILIDGVPFVSGVVGNFNLPSAIIEGCNFYNQNNSGSTVNYNTATYYGYGIQIGEKCDYTRVLNCAFNYIRIGVYSTSGGNTDITGCNFLGCMPKTGGAYTFGAVYIPSGGTNNGKINITSCKFNHMLGYSIYWNNYATAERPLTVSGCHFISNAATAIVCTNSSALNTRHMIMNNYFERTSQAFTNSWTGQPFGASLLPFISMNNQTRCVVRGNTFLNDGTYGVVTTNSSDFIVVKQNTWFNITGISSLVGANNQVADNDNI